MYSLLLPLPCLQISDCDASPHYPRYNGHQGLAVCLIGLRHGITIKESEANGNQLFEKILWGIEDMVQPCRDTCTVAHPTDDIIFPCT